MAEVANFLIYLSAVINYPLKEDVIEDFACDIARMLLNLPTQVYPSVENLMRSLQKEMRKEHKLTVKQYKFLSDLLIARFRFEYFIIGIIEEERRQLTKPPEDATIDVNP